MSTQLEEKDSHTLAELKKQITANSKPKILACLTRLRDDSQCCKRFINSGGLGLLVQLLKYQDIKIINATLSILANACIGSDARQEVRDTNIIKYTLWILRNLKVSDNLHCRACRLVGNLSDCTRHAKGFFDAGIIEALHDVLTTSANSQTYMMAIRAVRNIWSMYEGSHRKITDSGIIRTITKIFIDAGKQPNEPKCLDLAETCMKAMAAFLVGFKLECAHQMEGEQNEGYKTLVTFYEAKNKLAIKCIYSLVMIAECRPPLGTCGAVEATVQLVDKCPYYFKEILASLCLFCREAVNRIRIRYCSGIQVILDLLKKESYERYHPALLHSLVQFVYDDESIVIMVKNGLIDILTGKLTKMSVDLPIESEEKSTPKKRAADTSLFKRADVKYNRSGSGRYSMDYHRDDWSPKSAGSGSSTPPSSPSMKLFSNMDDSDENTDDENYSPVCSDNEWVEAEPHEEIESLKSFSSTMETEETQGSVKASQNEINKTTNIWTLILLSKLSYSDGPIEKLADPSTIGPLASCIRLTKNAKASRILSRIVKNRAYLMPLIKQGFVFEALTLSSSEQYTRELSAFAETGGAIGEFTSVLLRGQPTHRPVIAISIPFLIKSRDLLRNLLSLHGGLPIIFDVLADKDHKLHKEAVWSICHLADSLDLRPDALDKSPSTDICLGMPDTGVGIEILESKPSTVTFELDDGSTVDASRRLLCERSHAFSAMLEGSFLESGKRSVKLRKTSREGLNALLLAVCGSELSDASIESLLDAVLLADKFLMADVSERLTESSMSKLNHETFCRAWSWARNNDCPELKTSCLKGFLTAEMTRAHRLSAFAHFEASQHFSEFLDDMRDVISNGLEQR
ncbi:hypothetical protein QAD02_015712 [Eretmocerus hayati]|uniref:Uncharacterized protein n=1 Tax=Eretmocerus hayati TaxID=131215 RepID=A0ACC2P941_9HYME|nr:hypothetical protein QAD02_015712 [Eretmocerus hayati]